MKTSKKRNDDLLSTLCRFGGLLTKPFCVLLLLTTDVSRVHALYGDNNNGLFGNNNNGLFGNNNNGLFGNNNNGLFGNNNNGLFGNNNNGLFGNNNNGLFGDSRKEEPRRHSLLIEDSLSRQDSIDHGSAHYYGRVLSDNEKPLSELGRKCIQEPGGSVICQ